MQVKLPELITPDEVAQWLSITRKSVYMMVSKGAFPAGSVVKIGQRLRFDAAMLRRWVAEKQTAR